MKKQWIALVAVLCMVFCFGGCTATEAPMTEEPSTAETTQVPQAEPLSELTATVRVYNSEEITAFVEEVSMMQPSTYTNTRTVNGVETTYTLHYEGAQTAEARVVIETADKTQELTAPLFLMPYYGLFPDATGENLDVEAYTTAIEELGLLPVLEQKSLQTLYGVYVLGYVDMLGQPCVVDFWLNEQEVMQIELMQMLQGGMTLQ